MIQNINTGNHQWKKQNLVTLTERKGGSYDLMKCDCGLSAKRINFQQVRIDGRKVSQAKKCPNHKPKEEAGRKVKIAHCDAVGASFGNLKTEKQKYLDDLDNLIQTGHFPNDSIEESTFYHKEMTLKQFIQFGREIIRQSL